MVNSLSSEFWGDCEDFGAVFKELREVHGFKQQRLAWRLHVTKATISRWEKNELPHHMKVNDIKQVAIVLGCTTEEYSRLLEAFLCHVLSEREFGKDTDDKGFEV